jgi:hypothetical protein
MSFMRLSFCPQITLMTGDLEPTAGLTPQFAPINFVSDFFDMNFCTYDEALKKYPIYE